MLFFYSDRYKCRLDLGGGPCLKALILVRTLGLGRLFYSFFFGFQKVLRKGMMKKDKNLNVVNEWVLSSYMLFPGQKYLSGFADFHPLIREQSYYCQSSSPSKSFRLNAGYRYLRFLRPWYTFRDIFTCIFQEIKPKGGEPV